MMVKSTLRHVHGQGKTSKSKRVRCTQIKELANLRIQENLENSVKEVRINRMVPIFN